ncbi:hypothetical protein FNV43_RR01523 [Rhamnella rubrinervis]|uniref:PGG domain-containing protein n=1 Tax=Rhamnella rubrinervis TaxID=2594499 RepID=A0A8K0HSN3_9ROSA|nr:hypothetical protein FNV43_RR01523 [Rhamnella rubrinervis]
MLEIIKRCPDSSELVNNRGWNILHLAVQDISFQSPVEDILKTTSSLSNLINEKDAQGNTPLHHIAVSINHWRLGHLIDDPRVDKLAYNNENKNALDLASTSQNRFKKRLKTKGLRSAMRIYTPIEDSKQDIEKERQVDHLKKLQDANVIVAALIATVTFAAGLTIPGGFVSEKGSLEGTPILGRNLAFRTFMVMDTIAMVLSTSSVLAHLFINADLKARHSMVLATSAFYLTISAMVAMVGAFATGTYAILGSSIAFSIVICVLALSFIIVFMTFFTSYVKGTMRKKTPLR